METWYPRGWFSNWDFLSSRQRQNLACTWYTSSSCLNINNGNYYFPFYDCFPEGNGNNSVHIFCFYSIRFVLYFLSSILLWSVRDMLHFCLAFCMRIPVDLLYLLLFTLSMKLMKYVNLYLFQFTFCVNLFKFSPPNMLVLRENWWAG